MNPRPRECFLLQLLLLGLMMPANETLFVGGTAELWAKPSAVISVAFLSVTYYCCRWQCWESVGCWTTSYLPHIRRWRRGEFLLSVRWKKKRRDRHRWLILYVPTGFRCYSRHSAADLGRRSLRPPPRSTPKRRRAVGTGRRILACVHTPF